MARNPRRPSYFMGSTPKPPRLAATAANPRNPAYGAGTGWELGNLPTPWERSPGGIRSWNDDFIQDPVVSNPDYNWNTPAWESPTYTADQNVDRTAGGIPDYLDIAGYMPDYMGNIESDYEYTTAMADIAAANAAQEAATKQGIAQLAVGFGGDLSSLLSQGLIDQATADKAKLNEFSTMKELGRALERGNARATSSLGARGALDSGANAAIRSQLNEGYQRQSTAATNDLLNQVTGMRSNLAQGVAERRAGLSAVRGNVANRLMQMAMMQARPATRAKWNPQVGAYEAQDGSGRFYNRDGTPWGG